ncbi:MAG TPA: tRNA (N(6)-L-threonylcarbamoyladenosine(37)-C(2))-methylthiotransferase [Candidatus Pacearchaeota archaeon]|nr:(Dimethylallyl)adenosine tRNA methylthiotransferase MiaB [archaeon BMS3Abin17]HDK42132.1 tRNA (N(6)-L-threonylcarbamoyladenosine(37)-C(2))-methylthiotransferase [Candidatus Pacearchaeota archaeon]HDZ61090.1 tRNA (N(6)-L-threonylcarbamoyladenosine(37)-C(2))-methylthiotransferase [Candidatus Pacearchaeota archaeon]
MLELYFDSYGCTANHNSTEIMKGLVKQAGLNITQNIDYADFIIINSCIVKEPTQEKIRRKIQDLLDNGKKIILAGCMPKFLDKSLKDKVGNKLFLIGANHITNITNLIKDIQENNYNQDNYLNNRNEVKAELPKISRERYIGVNQISEGCLGECAYCIVRLAKGKLFSYPQEKIIQSVKNDVSSGCKEIWLTSQDNANYGNEEGKHNLPELLNKILDIKGNFFVRLGMMNPDNVLKILPELIELYKHKKMFKFLHIPIQSGSNKILNAMKRKYTGQEVIKIVREFKKNIPDIIIATDVIVGYPEETEKDFQETLDIVSEIKPEILNKSNFHPRPNTPAEKLKQISPDIMRKRAKQLSDLHMNICNNIQKDWMGKEVRVLVDKKGFENTYLGRTSNYKLVAIQSNKKILGRMLDVKVKRIMPHYLIATPI